MMHVFLEALVSKLGPAQELLQGGDVLDGITPQLLQFVVDPRRRPDFDFPEPLELIDYGFLFLSEGMIGFIVHQAEAVPLVHKA